MKTYFPEVKSQIKYEGPGSRNPLAFRYFDPRREVAGKPMGEHLKFAVAYWHAFQGRGHDIFGPGVYRRPWGTETNPLEAAESTLHACFEFTTKLGLSYYCTHDRDFAPEGATIAESAKNLEWVVERAEKLQKDTGVRLLWGTANLFSHPRYMHGAASNPDPLVMAHAAAQVRHALDMTVRLGGTGYVFWGGRDGYSSLLNTDMARERDQLGRFLQMAVQYGRSIGFKGTFFIEPKPKEPMTHQYDADAATTIAFLREYGLAEDFKLNLECNHATLAGHSFEHELTVASAAGMLGSMDVNRGNPLIGWDTDQFPTDMHSATLAMLIILKQGGLPEGGGLNFDAKLRRGSSDAMDLFHAHIGGMDTFARALLVADRIQRDGVFDQFLKDRYAGYESEMGKKILAGKATLPELEDWAKREPEPVQRSGREEMLENVLNDYLYNMPLE